MQGQQPQPHCHRAPLLTHSLLQHMHTTSRQPLMLKHSRSISAMRSTLPCRSSGNVSKSSSQFWREQAIEQTRLHMPAPATPARKAAASGFPGTKGANTLQVSQPVHLLTWLCHNQAACRLSDALSSLLHPFVRRQHAFSPAKRIGPELIISPGTYKGIDWGGSSEAPSLQGICCPETQTLAALPPLPPFVTPFLFALPWRPAPFFLPPAHVPTLLPCAVTIAPVKCPVSSLHPLVRGLCAYSGADR
jgi:hypothetical protein